MDSIERMRRMNELTKNLKTHGFADSSFDAIQQVEQIYGEDDLTPDVKHAIIKDKSYEAATIEEGKKMDSSEIRTINNKIVELNNAVLQMMEKMNEMIKVVNDVEQKVNNIRLQRETVREVVREVPREQQQREEPKPEVKEEPKKESGEYANQRIGNYTPTDVAIDKMFYYGKK